MTTTRKHWRSNYNCCYEAFHRFFIGMGLFRDGAIQKEWYREEDLHAAEADIREMEARTKTVYVDAHMCEMCNEAYETKALLNQHISQQHADIMTAITKTTRRYAGFWEKY